LELQWLPLPWKRVRTPRTYTFDQAIIIILFRYYPIPHTKDRKHQKKRRKNSALPHPIPATFQKQETVLERVTHHFLAKKMVLLPIRGRGGGSGRRTSPGPPYGGRGMGGGGGCAGLLRFLILGGCISLLLMMGLMSGVFSHGSIRVGVDERGFVEGEGKGLWEQHQQQVQNGGGYVLREHVSSSKGLLSGKQQTFGGGIDDKGSSGWEFVSTRDGDDYGLSEEQCNIAFPKLFFELEKSVKQREANGSLITSKEVQSRKVEDGMVRGIIYDGEVSIELILSLHTRYFC
jgi:hypothetical protein